MVGLRILMGKHEHYLAIIKEMTNSPSILTINAGSSSVKLVLFTASASTLEQSLEVTVTNIGQPNAAITVLAASEAPQMQPAQVADHTQALDAALACMQLSPEQLVAVGHRVVHGGPVFDAPTVMTPTTVHQLRDISVFDPVHLPIELDIIEDFMRRFPDVPHVACFDTAFFHDLPAVARLLPLPRTFESLGLRRYGFHGLSYAFLLQKFGETAGQTAGHGRIIIAHLGSGASLAAIKDGKPLDTTMAFTPASGIPMSTRAGDLDPGIGAFLHHKTGMTWEQFDHMVQFESGLLGVSGLSADMERLINESDHNHQAAEAVDLFCYQVQKTIGGFAAVLGGVDSIIFAGGMGEHAPLIRYKICRSLRYLGVSLDERRNAQHAFLISSDDSSVGVHVMHTDEAAIIASQTQQTIHNIKGN